MNINGTVGIINMFLLLMSLKLVERTLTLPVIMSSMLDAINWLLLVPVAFCIMTGLFFTQHEQLQVEDAWLKNLFFAGGGSLFCLLCIGIFASREKVRSDTLTVGLRCMVVYSNSLSHSPQLRGVLTFYAGCMSIVVILLGFACASSFIFAWQIGQIYGIKGDGLVGKVACSSQLYGCCCCENEGTVKDEELCPEWSRQGETVNNSKLVLLKAGNKNVPTLTFTAEIIHVIEADFKLAGLVAAISCLFAIRATRACWILIHNLRDYKCVYI